MARLNITVDDDIPKLLEELSGSRKKAGRYITQLVRDTYENYKKVQDKEKSLKEQIQSLKEQVIDLKTTQSQINLLDVQKGMEDEMNAFKESIMLEFKKELNQMNKKVSETILAFNNDKNSDSATR